VHQNPQHRSILSVVLDTSAPPFQTPPTRRLLLFHHHHQMFDTKVEPQTLPDVNRKHFFMNTLHSHFARKKSTTECCSLVIYSSIMVAILTTETSL
jgi:hypothetical protein